MGSERTKRRNRWPDEEPSPEKGTYVADLTREMSGLLDRLEVILGGDRYEISKPRTKVSVPPTEESYVISELVEKPEMPMQDEELVLSSPPDALDSISLQKKREAFEAGNISFSYLRGMMEHKRRHLDAAISQLTRCYDLAVETGALDYVVKAQIQLAVLHLKRFRKNETIADYRLALQYSNNLVQMGLKKDHFDRLRETWLESS